MLSRHEFLASLHALLKPRSYLEIGVQYGASLELASAAEVAIGIDPFPMAHQHGNQRIFAMTSDQYFGSDHVTPPLDLVFIDGSHLFEDALHDFVNVERFVHPGSVVVFDDVLPYSQEIAHRVMPPGGDWTGDVWKTMELIIMERGHELCMAPVNTFPTGTFAVWGFEGERKPLESYGDLAPWTTEIPVPDHVLDRRATSAPEHVLTVIKEYLCGLQ